MSGIIGLIFVLVVIGVCLYLVDKRIPMDPTIKVCIQVLVVLLVCWLLLSMAGLVSKPGNIW
jgi:hypothetical protein